MTRRRCDYFSFLLILKLFNVISCQNTFSSAIPYRSIESCADNQYFNSISLSCANCPQGQQPTASKDACKCATGSRVTGWTGGQLQCVPCPSGLPRSLQTFAVFTEHFSGLAVSRDGWNCVECRTSNNTAVQTYQSTGKCPDCRNNEVFETIANNANPNGPQIERCKPCPEGTQPNDDSSKCDTCSSIACFCSTNPALCNSTTSQAAGTIILENGNSFKSKYVSENLAFAESQCRSGQKQECQHLANMCVLQNYDRNSVEGACNMLENILRATVNGQSTLPALFYYGTEAPIELSRETAIEGRFNVDEGLPNRYLDFVSVIYSLNGTFLGLEQLQDGLMQICPTERTAADGTYLFGREYHQECTLRLSDLMESIEMKRTFITGKKETVFHELYLRFIDANNQLMMYPVPVLDKNLRQGTQLVNQNNDDNYSRWLLTRRFYLIDTQIEATDERGRLFRVPKLITFRINVQPSRDGHIFPPFVTIHHAEFLFSNNGSTSETIAHKTVDSTFQINYEIDSTKHDKTIEVLMAVFCSTSVLWGALRAYAWGRRAGKQIIDASTVLKLILFMTEIISNIFLLIIGCMAVWITFAYKLQKYFVYVMLSRDQEWIFITYVSIALGLKLVALIHLYATLALTETFFIDWERPKQILEPLKTTIPVDPSEAIQHHPMESKQAPVVIWRTYLVANEWNELKNYRKTSVASQMLLMVLLLEFFDFQDLAIVQPGFGRGGQPREFAESRLSRFAVNLSFYMIIGLIQWVVHVLVIEKIVDPFRNFMDLCSVANISVMAMTHPQRGYYIHGRSVHGSSDTNMQDMNMFLKREKDNLCGLRGLESNSELQTFVMNLPKAFRDKYDEITASFRSNINAANVRLTNSDNTTSKIENVAQVYEQLNQYLKDVIDHGVSDADYVITDSKFIEEVLGIEFADTTKIGNFTRDPSEMAYSNVFVYGNEWPHLSFEMLLFCVTDLVMNNRIFAASFTFFVSAAIQKAAKIFFTNNLIKSSFVDARFLI